MHGFKSAFFAIFLLKPCMKFKKKYQNLSFEANENDNKKKYP